MKLKNNITPGWRYFECPQCHEQWRSKCRDSKSCSLEFCFTCNEGCEPYRDEPHLEWPVDRFGNLIEDE